MDSSNQASPAAAATRGIHPLAIVAILVVLAGSAFAIWSIATSPATGTAAGGQSASNNLAAPAVENAPPVAPPPVYPAPPSANEAPPAPAPVAGPPSGAAPPAPTAAPPCTDCAMVAALKEVQVKGQGTGVGAVGGGVAGAVVGNQIGRGNGRAAMTILGAVGGALAGNAVEKEVRSVTRYELVVQYEDGHERKFMADKPWPYRVGDPVRVVKGRVRPRDG